MEAPSTTYDALASFATARPDVAKVASAAVAQTNERLDAEIGALSERLEALAARLQPVMQMSMPMSMPTPSDPQTRVSDTIVGDHSSQFAQEQQTRANRIASLTSLTNELLHRLEI